MAEMLAMTPYMMQIALNKELKERFAGKTYCGPGGDKELKFFEQNLPIDTERDEAVRQGVYRERKHQGENVGRRLSPVLLRCSENDLHCREC